jgi:hypothetical protein
MKTVFSLLVICSFVTNTYSQNVGVGTTSPTERLHVNGNIRADTAKANVLKITPNAGDGKILTSDASGNASWQARTTSSGGSIGYGTWGDCATNGAVGGFQPVSEAGLKTTSSFGKAISISGDFAIVGYSVDDIGGNLNQGSAFIYHFDGTRWTMVQKITDPGGAANDYFGASVAMSGNFLVVGAPSDDVGANSSQGSVCVFQYNGTSWVFTQRLIDAAGAAGDALGYSVAISSVFIVAGAADDDVGANMDQGSATVYSFNGSTWVFETKLSEPTGSAGDQFGASVSTSNYRVVIGIPQDDANGTNRGSANVYVKIVTWGAEIKLVDPSGLGSAFGISVSISGTYVLVGSPNIFNRGVAHMFQFTGFTFTFLQTLDNTNGHSLDFFGESVYLSGDYAIVGSKYFDRDNIDPDLNSGAAFIYVRVGTGWSLMQKVEDPTGVLVNGENFGIRVAIDGAGKGFLISATNFVGGRGKVVFGKVN